jgi:hypothetical protein
MVQAPATIFLHPGTRFLKSILILFIFLSTKHKHEHVTQSTAAHDGKTGAHLHLRMHPTGRT